MGCLFVLFLIASRLLKKILVNLGLASEDKEDEVDEKLGTYAQCLGQQNRKAWLIQEMHQRKTLKMQTVSDEMMEKLKDKGIIDNQMKRIKATPNYELTANYRYADQF